MGILQVVPVEVYLAVVFMLIDVVTGVLKAVKCHELSSTKARTGMYKKASFIAFIAFGYILDYTMKYIDVGIMFPAAATICTLIIVTECISILENIASVSPEILKYVKPFLSAFNKREETIIPPTIEEEKEVTTDETGKNVRD